MTPTQEKSIREEFIKKYDGAVIDTICDDVDLNKVADFFINKLNTALEEQKKEFDQMKRIYEMELDAISLKSLEDFVLWSSNRKQVIQSHK